MKTPILIRIPAFFALLSAFGVQAEERGGDGLLRVAAGHVAIAEESRDEGMLWGRIGGSEAERASARLLAEQLAPYLDRVALHEFEFRAHRPYRWSLRTGDGTVLQSAMPAPFDAKYPLIAAAPVLIVQDDGDWENVEGKWAFVFAEMALGPSRTSVREQRLYQKAVAHGAAGFVFALPTPEGRWQAVVPVDKPYAQPDTIYPDGVRPIPSFSIDAQDGALLAESESTGQGLSVEFAYEPDRPRKGINALGYLEGAGTSTTLIMAHLDSFFSGACDDASGLAVLVGLAERVSAVPLERRETNFIFAGISAHHDTAAGMRAYVEAYSEEFESVEQIILLEHLDARHGAMAGKTNWPENLNDLRAAYVGPEGWPEVSAVLPDLAKDSGLMTVPPQERKACIADLFVVCGEVKVFCLIQAPPYYHTNHDTLDKISEEGLQAALEFHWSFLQEIGAVRK